jgi:nucleotide-binding universal stress UspA family protein
MQLLNLKNILVATEPDETPAPPVVAASQLAEAAGASLHAVFVAASADGAQSARPRLAEAKAAMIAMFDAAGAHVEDTRMHVLEGDPASTIVALADRLNADVIVVGPHRSGRTTARALGGTALAIVTNAASPCLVVSNSLRLPLQRVLVPIDLSDTARGALLVGLSWASALRGPVGVSSQRDVVTLTALHVQQSGTSPSVPPRAIEAELDHVRQEANTWAGVSITGATTVSANVAQGIVGYVGDSAPDLVVMGTRGLGLDAIGRLGSVAASVMKVVDAPVLLVPPAVWMEHARKS